MEENNTLENPKYNTSFSEKALKWFKEQLKKVAEAWKEIDKNVENNFHHSVDDEGKILGSGPGKTSFRKDSLLNKGGIIK